MLSILSAKRLNRRDYENFGGRLVFSEFCCSQETFLQYNQRKLKKPLPDSSVLDREKSLTDGILEVTVAHRKLRIRTSLIAVKTRQRAIVT